jgi:cysteine desulfurase
MIYLDHHAATPLSAHVQRAIGEAHRDAWANPSSVHTAGRAANKLVEQARRCLAQAINAHPADIVLTSGGTEACNLAVLGVPHRGSVLTNELEHPAIRNAVGTASGDVGMIALQWVNHETGAIAAVHEYARHGVPVVIDACQALGKLPLDVGSLGASAVAFAATKIGGPAGAGALWVDRKVKLEPQLRGGPQERGRRAGTPDVAALAGFAAALEELPARLAAMPRIAKLRDELEAACLALGAVPNFTGDRVATVTNVSFRGWRSEILIAALDVEGVCASAGAACSSGVSAGSPVIAAMFPDEPWRASSALRLSLGPETTEEDVARAIASLSKVIRRA